MVHHTLDDAVDRIQEVGVLAHGQDRVDLGVQQVVAEDTTLWLNGDGAEVLINAEGHQITIKVSEERNDFKGLKEN